MVITIIKNFRGVTGHPDGTKSTPNSMRNRKTKRKKKWLAFYERERERETEKHSHFTRLTTIAKSVVTTFGLNLFRLAPFRKPR